MLDVAWKGASCYGAALPGTGREDATHGRARRRTRTDHTRHRTGQARGRGEPAAGACARPFCYGRRGCCRGGRRARLLRARPRRRYVGGDARGDGTVPRAHRGTELLRESTERRRHKERDRGRALHPAQRPHRHRGPGRLDRVERGSTLGQPGGRSALRTRLLRHEGRARHPPNRVGCHLGSRPRAARRRHRGGDCRRGERRTWRPLDRPARVPCRRRHHHRAYPSRSGACTGRFARLQAEDPGPLGPRRRPRRGRLGAGEVLPLLREPARAGAGAQRRTQPPALRGRKEQVPINIGVVRAGNWASTVPESLVAEGRVGLIPGEEVDPFKDLVSERISAVAERDPWLRKHPPELTWFGGQFEPAEVESDAPIWEAVKKAHERVTGEEPSVEGVPYGADMRLFIRFGGMPCVMYGAGDARVAHASDEHISVTELLTAASTLACLLADWCGVDEE